jgi:hypothetical protein
LEKLRSYLVGSVPRKYHKRGWVLVCQKAGHESGFGVYQALERLERSPT